MGSIGVLGGDRRQAELARLLSEEGWQVGGLRAAGPPRDGRGAGAGPGGPPCGAADAAVPQRRSGELDRGSPGRWSGCGSPSGRASGSSRDGIPPEALAAARDRGLAVTDYVQMESFTVTNAAITAEGAVQTALERLEGTLLRPGVPGAGVRPHRAAAELPSPRPGSPGDGRRQRAGGPGLGPGLRLGGPGHPAPERAAGRFGAVFNTVPAPVLTGAPDRPAAPGLPAGGAGLPARPRRWTAAAELGTALRGGPGTAGPPGREQPPQRPCGTRCCEQF